MQEVKSVSKGEKLHDLSNLNLIITECIFVLTALSSHHSKEVFDIFQIELSIYLTQCDYQVILGHC